MRRALLVLLFLALPATVQAQGSGLRASIAPVVHAYLQEQPPGSSADAVVSDKALAVAEWVFIASQSIHVAYGALRESQDAGATTQTIIVGVTSTAGTLALCKLLPARWQKFTALIAVGTATAIIDGKKIAQDIQAAKAK